MSNIEIRKAVFNFIYLEALDDATRRTEAASLKHSIEGMESVREIVKEYAESVVHGDNPCFYYYEQKIEDVLYEQEKYRKFTFGNIQKLINMTMKYLYIQYYDTDIYKNFTCCNVPLDSGMRDLIRKDYGVKTISWECAWSKITRESTDRKYSLDNYINFQDAVVAIVKNDSRYRIPLEFDYYNHNRMEKSLLIENK
ncbi:hypothetical protein [Butyrivibrio sp. XBB1001]|uniref:hypothetical protein n=1 Tax=Butyrivibrio sp. XBB1001 TaxID=1280682 RepID=UPI000404CB0D|nr:hypothetical protein [Butyrivibrio sp. XBB1001]